MYALWTHRLLLLGADPNKRSCRPYGSLASSTSPLLSVCVGTGAWSCSKTTLIAKLICCGADPSVDRQWFEASQAGGNNFTRRLDKGTREALADLCRSPPRLQTLSACVVRKCLAAYQFNGVAENADSLALPSSVKALLKLEFT